MAEYARSWRKKLRIKQLVDIAQHKLLKENYNDEDVKNIQEKLDSERKSTLTLIRKNKKEK